MNRLKMIVIVMFAASTSSFRATADDMDGEWISISRIRAGEQLLTPPTHALIKDGKFNTIRDGKLSELGRISVSPPGSPQHYNVQMTGDGELAGKSFHGIFSISADTMLTCVNPDPGGDRPKLFGSTAKNGSLMIIWMRKPTLAKLQKLTKPLDNQQLAARFSEQGLKLYKEGELQKSLYAFGEGLKASTTFAPLYYNRGLVWNKLKKQEKAIADFKSFIQLSPRDHDGYIKLGRAFRTQKKWKESEEVFSEGLEKCPRHKEASGASDSSASHANVLRRSVTVGHTHLLWNRAEMFAESKQFEKALKDYDGYLKTVPNDKDAMAARQRILNRLNGSKK